jgi:hypothetical protein
MQYEYYSFYCTIHQSGPILELALTYGGNLFDLVNKIRKKVKIDLLSTEVKDFQNIESMGIKRRRILRRYNTINLT